MPRVARKPSIGAVLEEILSPLAERLALVIAESLATRVASLLEADVLRRVEAKDFGTRRFRRRARGEITRWTADRNARRVPTYVIEATGLDTKKKIVANFGENAAFEKGKPLPKELQSGSDRATSQVKARPPIIRKKAKSAE